ncbi:MAG: hypothetical protein ACRCST_02310 [Turicibacter sp.]
MLFSNVIISAYLNQLLASESEDLNQDRLLTPVPDNLANQQVNTTNLYQMVQRATNSGANINKHDEKGTIPIDVIDSQLIFKYSDADADPSAKLVSVLITRMDSWVKKFGNSNEESTYLKLWTLFKDLNTEIESLIKIDSVFKAMVKKDFLRSKDPKINLNRSVFEGKCQELNNNINDITSIKSQLESKFKTSITQRADSIKVEGEMQLCPMKVDFELFLYYGEFISMIFPVVETISDNLVILNLSLVDIKKSVDCEACQELNEECEKILYDFSQPMISTLKIMCECLDLMSKKQFNYSEENINSIKSELMESHDDLKNLLN